MIRCKQPVSRDWRAPHRIGVASAALQTCLLLILFCGAARAQTDSEYAVKAAFLFHFAQLTNWPPGALQPEATVTFCTLGEDPFSGQLEKVIAAKSLQAHPISIVHLKDIGSVRSCQVLFLSQQQDSRLSAVLIALRGASVLVTGETDDLLHQGGMISFERQDQRVRFRVNTGAAAKCGISFSSTLLALASSVIGEE